MNLMFKSSAILAHYAIVDILTIVFLANFGTLLNLRIVNVLLDKSWGKYSQRSCKNIGNTSRSQYNNSVSDIWLLHYRNTFEQQRLT